MSRSIHALALVAAFTAAGCQLFVGIKETDPAADDASPGADTSIGVDSGEPDTTVTPDGAMDSPTGDSADSSMPPGDAAPGICEPKKRRCVGLLLQECNAAASGWADVETCKSLCLDGACSGTCKPGEITCKADNKTPQICDSAGGQLDLAPCAFACAAGKCTGECVPSSKGCTDKTPFTCDGAGKKVEGTACTSVCMDGTCVDKCTVGSKQCSGNIPQTCDASGAYVDGAACPFVCRDGTCTGECVPGSKQCSGKSPQTCDASGKWVTAASPCEFTCSGGECLGCKLDSECTNPSLPICEAMSGKCVVCLTGAKQCSGRSLQECSTASSWADKELCPYACAGGACTGECVPGTTRCSGRDSQTCSAAGAWATTSTCNVCSGAGICSGVCVPGAKQCSGKTPQTCDATGNWTSGAVCTYACTGGSCTTGCASNAECTDPTKPQCDPTTKTCVDCITKNACGGCGTLAGTPGAACGTTSCGKWTCSADKKSVTCAGDVAGNLCGGCAPLTSGGKPGDTCGTYSCGKFVCSADKTHTTCSGDNPRNSCGGCAELKFPEYQQCTVLTYSGCGQCEGTESSVCNYKDPYRNECGGCSKLKYPPGTSCPPPSGGKGCGVYKCDKGGESTSCYDGCLAGYCCKYSFPSYTCAPGVCG